MATPAALARHDKTLEAKALALAVVDMGGGCYRVASASRPGEWYTVTTVSGTR